VSQFLPGGEPFLHAGDDIGCLLIHGLTATPDVMRQLGDHLGGQGRTVVGVRLFGHATRVDDLQRAHFRDWLASVEDGWALLQASCRHRFLIGHSLGGSISLTLAAELEASGVVAISALDRLPYHRWLGLLRPLRYVLPRVPKSKRDDWHSKEAARRYIAYPSYPTNAVLQFRNLLEVMNARLPTVEVPLLFVQPPDDRMTGPGAMGRLYQAVSSQHKEMLMIEGSNHIVPMDAARQVLFEAVAAFIERVVAGQLAGSRVT